ncbi:SCO family protein [Ramlibacter sp. MMS24-I3-19]|uniref:SCO family protein n=1 Tax=Ramlibacter sp. MMS24-I3-19 TaxID=3416606 RepID=UPI003D00443E
MSGSSSSNPAAKHVRPDQPLDLTVHALPGPREVEQAQRTATGRLKMLVVMLICAAPVIASYFTYYVVRPSGHAGYGQLIEPQRDMPPIQASTLEGQPQPLRALQGQWLLVSVAGGGCTRQCENHLYLQRQLRESLGKDKERLDWVWLVDDAAPVRDSLRPALAQADVLRVPREQLAQWLQSAEGSALEDHLYVIDPMGHWMMRFPPGMDRGGAAKAKRDIERLLRASAGWDQPGRQR